MTPTNFRKPKTAAPLLVQFRNGQVAGPYLAGMLRWNDSGHDFDVVAVERANGKQT